MPDQCEKLRDFQNASCSGGPSVRFDTCLIAGTTVSPYYDSLFGKLIVYAKTREEMLRKIRAALCEVVIDGIPTNIVRDSCES